MGNVFAIAPVLLTALFGISIYLGWFDANTVFAAGIFLAAFWAACDQLLRLNRYMDSRLPLWFWEWKTALNPVDAWHQYQAWKMILLGAGLYYAPHMDLMQVVSLWFQFYQARNIFMHIALLTDRYYAEPLGQVEFIGAAFAFYLTGGIWQF